MCSLHHKLFDFGAFTIDAGHRVLVSEQVNGSSQVEGVLLRHHGAGLLVPRRQEELPNPEFLNWHVREVFKERALP
jgi:putative restriction endonuclease